MAMGIDKASCDRRSNHYWETGKDWKRQKKLSPVQVLYSTCKDVFGNSAPGIIPSPENIQRLKAVLDGMTEADVGMKQNMQIFKAQKKQKFPTITYIQVYECDKFSIGLFCLPPGAVIPLHNHPEMTVFCKLLFGTMHINSFDWVNAVPSITSVDVNPPNANGGITDGPPSMGNDVKVDKELTATANGVIAPAVAKAKVDCECTSPTTNGVASADVQKLAAAKVNLEFTACSANGVISTRALRLAKTKVDSKFIAPCNTSVLYPADGGNLHCFTALTSCAFLDVLGPPYCDPEGRHCTYYRKYPFAGLSAVGLKSVPEEERESYAWLEERERPDQGSLIYGKPYKGPKFVTK